MSNADSIRREITEKIVAALEGGQTPMWRQPWLTSKNAGRAANFISRRPYSGINVLLLGLHSMQFDHRSRWFGTFEQWKQIGGMVKKRPVNVESGQWGCRIIFYSPVKKKVADKETNEQRDDQFFLMRTYTVFNADQVDGEAADKFRVADDPDAVEEPQFESADELIAASGADIRIGGDRAVYHRPVGSFPNHIGGDYIEIPHRRRFALSGAWYETALHELAHWSEVRLGWDHDKQGYAAGELVAELAACMIASELRIPQGECLENHAAYLGSWLRAMKADPRFIFKASSQASKVCDYLLSFRHAEAVIPADVSVEQVVAIN